MKILAIYHYLVFLGLIWPLTILAQDDLPEPQMMDPGPPPPGLVVPIDSNIIILLIIGLILGAIFILKFRRKLS